MIWENKLSVVIANINIFAIIKAAHEPLKWLYYNNYITGFSTVKVRTSTSHRRSCEIRTKLLSNIVSY